MLDIKKTLAKMLGQTEFRTLLWTGTASTFSGQTVSLNLSGYDYVEVFFGKGGSVDAQLPNPLKIPVGDFRRVIVLHSLGVSAVNENTGSRIVTANTNGVVFSDYTYKNRRSGGTLTTSNNFCVPHKIYGIKLVGGVLLNSISKAFSHLQKIGGGVNAGHKETVSENAELDKSTVHNSLRNGLWKQPELKHSHNSTDSEWLYVCLLGISKLIRMGRVRISRTCRQDNNKAMVPFVQSEWHEQSYARLGAICKDICITSERRCCYA